MTSTDAAECEIENMPVTLDAREMSCTMLQRCETYDDPSAPAFLDGQRVSNYWDEIERRGEAHVLGCEGIYPTGYDPDGSPRFDGPVCTFGAENDALDGPDAA